MRHWIVGYAFARVNAHFAQFLPSFPEDDAQLFRKSSRRSELPSERYRLLRFGAGVGVTFDGVRTDGVGVTLGDAVGDGDSAGAADTVGVGEALGVGDSLGLGVSVGVGVAVALGEGVGVGVTFDGVSTEGVGVGLGLCAAVAGE